MQPSQIKLSPAKFTGVTRRPSCHAGVAGDRPALAITFSPGASETCQRKRVVSVLTDACRQRAVSEPYSITSMSTQCVITLHA